MEKITKGHPLSQSADIVQENLQILKTLFPTIVKEGKIDVEELKALLDEDIESNEEYYRFTWAGKNEARREANKPSTATLRPCKEESKNWDNTQNIFIEGDNLEVLKLLQKSYAGKIKMMYFDPPYNTGKDFVYKDNYADNLGNYLAITGQTDEEGKKISTNTESDGRYHSNWLNMMYPRLKLARNLMSEDGVIFIHIDDNEVENLRKLCNEIFGEENFICNVINRCNPRGSQASKYFAVEHEYILVYSKSINYFELGGYEKSDDEKAEYSLKDENGLSYRLLGLRQRGGAWKREHRPKMYYSIYVNPLNGAVSLSKSDTFSIEVLPKRPTGEDSRWTWGKELFEKSKDLLVGKIINRSNSASVSWDIFRKDYLEKENGTTLKKPRSIWDEKEVNNQNGRTLLKSLFNGDDIFDFPKSIFLPIKSISSLNDDDFITMDFFAGSGTTANAVFQQNADDGGKRKFICVQLPEPTNENSEAYKAGYKNIAEICKERIRRAGEAIINEKKNELINLKKSLNGKILQDEVQEKIDNLGLIIDNLDIGFKAFKLDSSNIHAWDGNVENFEQNLFNAQNNIKENRSEDDVLYEILLKYGLDLTVPIEEKNINTYKIYSIGGGVLFVCLSDNITTQVADAIGKWKEELKPATCRALFKDNGFKDDIAKTNSIQILRQYGIEEANSI